MTDYSREKHEALRDQDQPPINPRYYRRYADVVDRMGVWWLEEKVLEWDHPETVPRRRGVSGRRE